MLLYTMNMGPVYKIRAMTANALEDAVTKLTITSVPTAAWDYSKLQTI